MRQKLLELAHWRGKQNGHHENLTPQGPEEGASEQGALLAPNPVETLPVNFAVELLPVDDIYRAAGVLNVRHSIHRVVEMLRSEHIRNLPAETKRAAVLMALEAWGIAVDQVEHDAKLRLSALDSYEADQKKQVEAEWARKLEENVQLQVELERVKSAYMVRIARNLESVDRGKATFNAWATKKQQESESIAEAAAVLTRPAPKAEACPAPLAKE